MQKYCRQKGTGRVYTVYRMGRTTKHYGFPGWHGGRYMTAEEEKHFESVGSCDGNVKSSYVREGAKGRCVKIGRICVRCYAFYPLKPPPVST